MAEIFENELTVKREHSETHRRGGYPVDMTVTVAEIVSEARKVLKMTQSTFGKRVARVSQSSVSKWEKGDELPGSLEWERVIRFLAADQRTKHLAYRWISSLFDGDNSNIGRSARELLRLDP